jgi:hypothetical protein
VIIAIQPDRYGHNDASSPIWTRLLREAGHEVREVDVFRADILHQIKGCAGFMWRYAHYPELKQIARRLLPVLEHELGLVVYPDQKTSWHYDDKVAQAYLLEAAGIPAPKTWVWFDRESALAWARNAGYPLVIKLSTGAAGTNVRMLSSYAEACYWIERLFDFGTRNMDEPEIPLCQRIGEAAVLLLKGRVPPLWEVHRGYLLFQEFLEDNPFDTRVTVIGDRAFAFRRFNREGDFRASGSGRIDWDPAAIMPEFVDLAFSVARKLGTQSCAIDGLLRNGEPVVGEISYTYVSWAVEACPGYWDSSRNWHERSMWPEEAQIEDFLVRLRDVSR